VGEGDDDVLVFYFAGHGLTEDRDRHYLLCSDSRQDDTAATALPTEDIVRILARTGLRNLLLILDTCYAGAGAADSAQVVLRGIARRADGDGSSGVWILSTARRKDEAIDGVFVDILADTLAEVRERTGQRQRYLDLTDVVAAANRRLSQRSFHQRAELTASLVSDLAVFLPNSGFRANLPREDTDLEFQRQFTQRELHDHFGPRSRGVDFDSEHGLYFHGREQILRELIDWLIAMQPADGRGRIVTGSPGCGKSAVLGRIVAMSDPAYRGSLLREPEAPGANVPANLVDVAVHARHKRLQEMAEQIAASLGLPAEGTGHLLREISLLARGRPRPLVIVVDALDEAGSGTSADAGGKGEPRRIARELLRPISEVPGVRLLVGTRPELISSLGTGMEVCNLDDHKYLHAGDIAGYVAKVLLAADEPEIPTPYRGRPDLAGRVGDAVAERADGIFLVARMAARSLRSDSVPVDITSRGWQDSLPSEIGEAFEDYLDRFGSDEPRVRALLYPLAFAEGKGLPRGPVWIGIAAALAAHPFDDEDVDWLLDRAQAYIAEVTDSGRSAYRLYHQALAEYLRTTYRGDAQYRLVDALLALVPGSDADRDYLAAPAYVRAHLATHAAAAGRLDDLLDEPGFLLAAEQLALVLALTSARSERAQRVRSAYEQAAHQLAGSSQMSEKSAYLQLAARRSDADDLADRVDQLGLHMPWRARWAWWSSSGVHRQLIGHERSVYAAAVGDLDGRAVAVTGGADNVARIWDLATQRQLGAPLRHGQTPVSAVAIGELGEYSITVTGGNDGRLRVWDLSSGQPLGEPLVGHTNLITSIALHQRGGETLAVSGSRDGSTRVWNLHTGLPVGQPLTGHRGPVDAVALAPLDDRTLILTGGADNRVRLWGLDSLEQDGDELIGHVRRIMGVGVAVVDGRHLVVSGSEDGRVGLWDLRTRRQVGEPIEAHPYVEGGQFNGVLSIAVGEVDGLPVAVTSGRDVARIWNLRSRQLVGPPLAGHYGEIYAVVLGTLGRTPFALTAGEDRSARIWDLTADRPVAGHSSKVASVAIGRADGRCLAVTGGDDTTALIWDLDAEGRQDGPPLTGHNAPVSAVALTDKAGEPIVATGSVDTTVRLHRLSTRQPVGPSLTGHTGPVTALEFLLRDGLLLLASGSLDGTVRLWDVHGRRFLGPILIGHDGDVDLLAAAAVGNQLLILAAEHRGHASAWDLRTGEPVPVTRRDPDHWWVVAVGCVSGRAVALYTDSGNALQLWDLLAGSPLTGRLTGHTNRIERAVLAERGGDPVAVTADWDGEIWVWNLRNGTPIGTPLVGQSYGIRGMAAGPQLNGAAVVAAGDNYKAQTRLWSLTTFQQVGDALGGRMVDAGALAQAEVDGRRILIAANDLTVRIHDLNTGRQTGAVLNGHQSDISAVATAELDGPVAVSSGYDRTVRVWDLRTRKQRFHWAHTDYCQDLKISQRRGRPIVIVASGSNSHIWDLAERQMLGELVGHTGRIVNLASADWSGRPVLLSGARDGTARLWDLDALASLGTSIPASDSALLAVALDAGANGLTGFTGDSDGVVAVWDPISGTCVPTTIPGFDRQVSSLTTGFMYGFPVLAMAGDSGVVRLWCRQTEQIVAEARLGTDVQGLLLTPDGDVCVATAMGVLALHVSDWTGKGDK
jgi:WD40 repeat protein